MNAARYRVFRGTRSQGRKFDGDTLDGVGAALRAERVPPESADAELGRLIQELNAIEGTGREGPKDEAD